jgi:hypothetical protein
MYNSSNPNKYEAKNHTEYINDSKFIDFDIIFRDDYNYFAENTSLGLSRHLLQYKNTFNNISGLNVQKIELLPISELDDIIENISNKRLPLKEWGDEVIATHSNNSYINEVHFGDLKPYIPKDYSWLYSTTYWNSTKFNYGNIFVFTAEQGKLCGAGFEYCAPTTSLGCGIRPVLEINESDLHYQIKTKTDGNGTIEVVENSLGGETIQFKVSANKDYKLKGVVIKTDSGEEVEFTEGEITENDDGTISIDKNKFTMPYENVTIEARWIQDIVNPYTGNKLLFFTLLISITLGIGTFIYKRKEANNKA